MYPSRRFRFIINTRVGSIAIVAPRAAELRKDYLTTKCGMSLRSLTDDEVTLTLTHRNGRGDVSIHRAPCALFSYPRPLAALAGEGRARESLRGYRLLLSFRASGIEWRTFEIFATSFENWGCRLAARRPGDLSQCHSEERSDEESACYLFRGESKT